MVGYTTDIEKATKDNDFFRKVLFTAGHRQLVVMTLRPGEEIGMEVHPQLDQFIRIEEGEGEAVLDGKEYALRNNSAVVVPAGTRHNIVNTSKRDKLRLYTIYSPPQHPDGTIHKTKSAAEAAEAAEAARR
ncbi:MAG: cupin domain-containing protein [Chloroflexi bacterium]|nr:cupin domain-containing protein [Chloroflexota bacterium]